MGERAVAKPGYYTSQLPLETTASVILIPKCRLLDDGSRLLTKQPAPQSGLSRNFGHVIDSSDGQITPQSTGLSDSTY
jgi:hypothetical protein